MVTMVVTDGRHKDHSMRGGHRDDGDSRAVVRYGDHDVIKMPQSSGEAPSQTTPGFLMGGRRDKLALPSLPLLTVDLHPPPRVAPAGMK